VKQDLILVTPLARAAISCGTCFDAEHLARAGIAMAQPFSIGANFQPGGVAVVGINPGAAKDGGCKEARKRALERFAAGDDTDRLLGCARNERGAILEPQVLGPPTSPWARG